MLWFKQSFFKVSYQLLFRFRLQGSHVKKGYTSVQRMKNCRIFNLEKSRSNIFLYKTFVTWYHKWIFWLKNEWIFVNFKSVMYLYYFQRLFHSISFYFLTTWQPFFILQNLIFTNWQIFSNFLYNVLLQMMVEFFCIVESIFSYICLTQFSHFEMVN